ncbi:MAG: protein kinase domain-containing protein [bacterium]
MEIFQEKIAKDENNINNYPDYLIDEEGHRHQLTGKLGQGGQGAVYKTSDKNVVVKVVVDELGRIVKDRQLYRSFKSEIDEIRILNLPDDIHIATPVLMLKEPYNGYIMQLLSGMVPIKKLMIPSLSEKMNLAEFYIKTGGVRRRLKLLYKIARILLRLHSLPVVYGDISPENIFVSSDVSADEVWFIDADNMRYTMDFSNIIYTPGYGAPEIVKGISGNNTLTDSYSFALLAFELLAVLSPFDGEYIESGDGGWDDEEDDDVDNYEKAQRGELPWVEDEDDDSNFSDKGIPRNIVLSKRMRELFQQTFGYQGRVNPAERPGMEKWYRVLKQALDAIIQCPHCEATYFYNNTCPFCNNTREHVYYSKIYDYFKIPDIPEESRKKMIGFKFLDISTEPQFLYNYHTGDPLMEEGTRETVEIKFGKYINIRNISLGKVKVKPHEHDEKILKKGEQTKFRHVDEFAIYNHVGKFKTRAFNFKKI